MNYKKEFIKRIIFIMDSAKYLIKPMNSPYLTEYYIYLEQKERRLLEEIECLLLSDKLLEDNMLYQKTLKLKKDSDYLDYLNSQSDRLIDAFTLLSIIRKYIERERIESELLNKKLTIIDDYFRVVRYKNNQFTYKSGANIESGDILNHMDIETGIIKTNFYDHKKNNFTVVFNGNFLDYISDSKNHHPENASFLTEDEKQRIYLMFHDEIPWNTKNICQKSDLFFSDNYCNQEYYLNEEDIFYFSGNYYMMCPNCYNIALIDTKNISSSILSKIKEKSLNNHNVLRNAFYKREYFLNEKQKQLIK